MKTIWTFPWPGSAVTTNTSIDCSQAARLEMRDELVEVSGGKSVPVLTIGGEIVRGFNPSAYERALGG
jgi:hypothetical protein